MAPRTDETASGRAGNGPTRTRRRFLGDLASVGARGLAAPTLGRVALSRVALTRVGPAIGVGGLLAACGDDTPANTPAVGPTIVPLFAPDRVLVAGRPQRIPLAIVAPATGDGDGDGDGEAIQLPDDDEAITITVTFDGETIDQVAVLGRVVEHDHLADADPDHQHADLFRYYPLRTTLPEPGIYDLSLAIGDAVSEIPIQAFAAEDASLPLVGDPFPVVRTPTATDPLGVDRLCTRFEPCPFHALDAAELIGAGRPLALLVATPAFCSTAYCGPVLETLIEATAGRDDLDVVHVEVYANTDEVGGNIVDPAIRLVSSVQELGLTFEPSLFLIDGAGMVVDRIDNVFDATELLEALEQLTG